MNERMKLLEAVVEAARNYVTKLGMHPAWPELIAAVEAFDALPTQPAGETVTLAVWEDMSSGVVALVVPGSDCDDPEPNCRRLGTITLEVTP